MFGLIGASTFSVATPPITGAWPDTAVPIIEKVTVPVGIPVAGGTGATVALKTVGIPTGPLAGFAVSVVDVGTPITV